MEKKELLDMFASRLNDLHTLVMQTNKMPVLIISQHPLESMTGCLLPNIRESISNVICFVEVGDTSIIETVLRMTIGSVDRIILDIDNKRYNSQEIVNTVMNANINIPILHYSDLDVWGNTSVDFVNYIEKGIRNKNILVSGNSFLSTRIIIKLLNKGANVYLNANEYSDNFLKYDKTSSIIIQNSKLHFSQCEDCTYDVIIGASIFNNSKISSIIKAKNIYDIGLNNFTKEFISSMQDYGTNVYRYDNRAGISSVLLNLLETEYLVEHNMGKVRIGDIEVISGGIMGKNGAIVVDNAFSPQFIVGVANGSGVFIPTAELSNKNKEDLDTIERLIYKNR